MSRLSIAGVLVLLCVCAIFADTQSAISGRVVDSEGAAIANARVLIHWDPSGSAVGLIDNIGIPRDVIVATDSNGDYLANVPPGFYDVFVSVMAFTPTAAKVRVKQGQLTTFSPMLRADALVMKELGHEISPAAKGQ
jgi:hypothetical protein